MTIIDHEREDDYAAAIENNRAAALAWLNTALKKMSHDVASEPHWMFAAKKDIPLRRGANLRVTVTFRPREENP